MTAAHRPRPGSIRPGPRRVLHALRYVNGPRGPHDLGPRGTGRRRGLPRPHRTRGRDPALRPFVRYVTGVRLVLQTSRSSI
jgi:hypothetical protein